MNCTHEIIRLIQSLADPPIVGRAEEALRTLIAELVEPEVKPLSPSHAIWAYGACGSAIGILSTGLLGYVFTFPKRQYALSEPKLAALEVIVEMFTEVATLLDEDDKEQADELFDAIMRVDAHVADEAQRAEFYDAAFAELGAALRRPEGWWDVPAPDGKEGWWGP